ncbi:MAG: GntR family transcriptional regulator [Alphaproteobacteria bacterium]|nr:GntR family transcriptional regulator [Alphaproteobacteria bacterium]
MTDGQTNLEEHIAREIEEDIIFGRLEPGARLREEHLHQRFGGSRHFVRQALVRLERVGIVVRERNKGAAVRSFSAAEVLQIYEVREMLQRQAALRIPLPVADADVAPIAAIHADYERCADAGDLRGVHEANDRFHTAIFGLCGNEYLLGLVKQYMDLTYAIRAKTLAEPDQLAVSRAHHALMIEYLKGTDPWALAELCVQHVRPSKDVYLRRIQAREQAGRKVVTPLRRRARRA